MFSNLIVNKYFVDQNLFKLKFLCSIKLCYCYYCFRARLLSLFHHIIFYDGLITVLRVETSGLKVGISSSKESLFNPFPEKPFRNDEKCCLFHLISCFCS